MTKLLALVLLAVGLTGAVQPPKVQQKQQSRGDVAISDSYNLYDRNREGLDWNRYNYPGSGQQRTDR